jgi:Zn finger protein HypA/HybF involved in hydrogenase expression
MHEIAIIQSLIEIAENEARGQGGSNIRRLKLKSGEFRGVVTEAAEFSFSAQWAVWPKWRMEDRAHV